MSTPDAVPSWPPDPVELLRRWRALWGLTQDVLVQPILPGWFSVTNNNSTAPGTEADVVAMHSYGRQLGRISDALELLIEAQPASAQEARAYSQFLSMKADIDRLKKEAAARRLAQIPEDLALLQKSDKAEYERLRKTLRDALD
jgi:hypothetical protein